ncbi:vacuolar amino acid transporter [Salix suchowensis]|nr:vacuolar amino acid transporter [Salix suchowensis]
MLCQGWESFRSHMHYRLRTYPDIGERAFGRKGRLLVSVVMYAELYLVAAGFLILEGDNLQSLFPNMGLKWQGFDCVLCSMHLKLRINGSSGYLMFGSNVESQITLSLPTHKLSSRLAIYTTLVNPIAKYALMVTPIVKVTKSWFPLSCNNRPLSLFISTAFVISNVTVALSVPFFGDLMSLVGAFLSMTAATVLPCLCYMKISKAHRRFGFEMVVLVSVVLLGISVVVSGTYTSLLQIIGHL